MCVKGQLIDGSGVGSDVPYGLTRGQRSHHTAGSIIMEYLYYVMSCFQDYIDFPGQVLAERMYQAIIVLPSVRASLFLDGSRGLVLLERPGLPHFLPLPPPSLNPFVLL